MSFNCLLIWFWYFNMNHLSSYQTVNHFEIITILPVLHSYCNDVQNFRPSSLLMKFFESIPGFSWRTPVPQQTSGEDYLCWEPDIRRKPKEKTFLSIIFIWILILKSFYSVLRVASIKNIYFNWLLFQSFYSF